MPGQLRPGPVGRVDVGLDLGKRDGRLGDRAVGEVDAVPGILPALVDQAVAGLAAVLDEPVAVGVAVGLDPLQRPVGVRQQRGDCAVLAAPALELAEQHDEQRRRVRTAVVRAAAAERERGGRAKAHLVQDLARLLLRARVEVAALPGSQRSQRAERETRIPGQQHPRGQQRVAAEQRHEPRRARRRRPASADARDRRCAARQGPRRCGRAPAARLRSGVRTCGPRCRHLRIRLAGSVRSTAWPRGWRSCIATPSSTGTASMVTVRSAWPGTDSRHSARRCRSPTDSGRR